VDELVTDWQVVAARIWGILIRRLAPQQVAALRRIAHTHPTTRELARYLEVSEAQAGNITRQLYSEGFLTRAKSGRSYRWSPAFPHPISLHYFDREPIAITDPEAVERVEEILQRRGKL
jgi:DNA-binding IclR family transcriptional regulator